MRVRGARRAGSPTCSSSSPTRAVAARDVDAAVVHQDRLGDLAPTRCTGLSECRAPWKTIDASSQRTARSRPQRIAQHVLAVEQHLRR